MTDVRRLVGIDAGVLDQNFSCWNLGRRLAIRGQGCSDEVALDSRVDVTGSGEFDLVETLDRTKAGNDLLGNLARGFTQLFRQLEGERQSILAERGVGWLLDDDLGKTEIVGLAQEVAHALGQPALQMLVQGTFLTR